MTNLEIILPTLIAYATLPPQDKSAFLQAHPELLEQAVVEYAFSRAQTIQRSQLVQLKPSQAEIQDFTTFALAAYDIAAEIGEHAICADAAGILAEFSRRFGEYTDKEVWLVAQSIHSVLTYPTPKFSSTFDNIISSAVSIMSYHSQGEIESVAAFFRQVSDLICKYIGPQAIDELLKFLNVPHNPQSVAASLICLVHLHLRGLPAAQALPLIARLAQSQSANNDPLFVLTMIALSP
ncbi:MAG: hypothetical protein AB1894_20910 [Chloroflexota bacterium]